MFGFDSSTLKSLLAYLEKDWPRKNRQRNDDNTEQWYEDCQRMSRSEFDAAMAQIVGLEVHTAHWLCIGCVSTVY